MRHRIFTGWTDDGVEVLVQLWEEDWESPTTAELSFKASTPMGPRWGRPTELVEVKP